MLPHRFQTKAEEFKRGGEGGSGRAPHQDRGMGAIENLPSGEGKKAIPDRRAPPTFIACEKRKKMRFYDAPLIFTASSRSLRAGILFLFLFLLGGGVLFSCESKEDLYLFVGGIGREVGGAC